MTAVPLREGTGDGYIHITLAAQALKRPIRTLRTWVNTGTIAHRWHNGRLLVYFGDALHADTKRGRRDRACASIDA